MCNALDVAADVVCWVLVKLCKQGVVGVIAIVPRQRPWEEGTQLGAQDGGRWVQWRKEDLEDECRARSHDGEREGGGLCGVDAVKLMETTSGDGE